jgi:hypothetical protein
MSDLERRSRRRRQTFEVHSARSVGEAEAWDLDYWQRRTADERLSALVAIHREVALIEAGRKPDADRDG